MNIVKSIRAKKWKITKGKLISWNFKTTQDSEQTKVNMSHLLYSYNVDGEELEGDKLGFGAPTSENIETYEKLLKTTFENAPDVHVFYSPDNPKKSILCPGIQKYHVKIIMIYLLCLIFLAMFSSAV